jgi:hypothetical protein
LHLVSLMPIPSPAMLSSRPVGIDISRGVQPFPLCVEQKSDSAHHWPGRTRYRRVSPNVQGTLSAECMTGIPFDNRGCIPHPRLLTLGIREHQRASIVFVHILRTPLNAVCRGCPYAHDCWLIADCGEKRSYIDHPSHSSHVDKHENHH